LSRLAAAISDLRLHGHPERRLPNTLNVSVPGMGRRGSRGIDQSACHAGRTEPSGVLLAMGPPRSWWWGYPWNGFTTQEDVRRAADAVPRWRHGADGASDVARRAVAMNLYFAKIRLGP